MLENNLNIGESLKRKGKKDVIVKSIIWSTIIDIFKLEKKIDITQYLISIQLKNNIILVKTNKPLINSELILLDEKIKKASKEKLLKIGIKLFNFDIKYIY